jgi:hypothetical protein
MDVPIVEQPLSRVKDKSGHRLSVPLQDAHAASLEPPGKRVARRPGRRRVVGLRGLLRLGSQGRRLRRRRRSRPGDRPPFQDVGADGAEGAVAVLRGGPAGLTATAARLWSQDSTGVPGVAAAYDWFGDGLASADYGRSGHDDLAIGARQEDVRGLAGAGAVTVLYGSAIGLMASGSQRWT